MKALKLKLFVTMITLTAVIIATTIPAQAQRRSTQNNTEIRELKNNKSVKRTSESRKTFNHTDKVRRSSVNSNLKSASKRTPQKTSNITSRNSNSRKNSARSYQTANSRNPKSQAASRSSRNTKQQYSKERYTPKSNSARTRNNEIASTRSVKTQSNSTRNTVNNKSLRNAERRVVSNRNTGHKSSGNTVRDARSYHRVDKSDKRYKPGKNYKGSSKSWNRNYRPAKMNYNRKNRDFYAHYNYHRHNHWDRSWERYRWGFNSWRDYYNGYHPHSYVYHKYYYHHNHYGHVIRRFATRPNIFVHNHHKYYCYNGHFFRYHRGIGYVLADLPFGFTFEYLPYGYERVNINGYLYFRVGNLFFESSSYGFRLVHYPERYYASEDGYNNRGYYYEDDIYYDEYWD